MKVAKEGAEGVKSSLAHHDEMMALVKTQGEVASFVIHKLPIIDSKLEISIREHGDVCISSEPIHTPRFYAPIKASKSVIQTAKFVTRIKERLRCI